MTLDSTAYMPINGFTTVDLGCERGNNVYNFVNKIDAPLSQAYIWQKIVESVVTSSFSF